MKPNDQPAFPRPENGDNGAVTLRDYFAAKAMQGWLAGAANLPSLPPAQNIVDYAYDMADAMLAEREKEQP